MTLSKTLISRLTTLRDRHATSVSAIVEVVIEAYLDKYTESELDSKLRMGGGRRRPS